MIAARPRARALGAPHAPRPRPPAPRTLRRLVRDLAERPGTAGRAGGRARAGRGGARSHGRRSSTPAAATPRPSPPAPVRSATLDRPAGPSLAATRMTMTRRLTADEAAADVHAVDTIGMPLGPGQPPAFLEALGRRTDWERPPHRRRAAHRAHRPVLPSERALPERLLRAARAAAARQRRQHRLRPGRLPALRADPRGRRRRGSCAPPPRRPTPTAGAACRCTPAPRVGQLHAAGADPDAAARRRGERRASRAPCGIGRAPPRPARRRDRRPHRERPRTDRHRGPAAHRRRPGHRRARARPSCPTAPPCRPGIGAVPSTVVTLLAEGPGGGYGIHSEMFTTGLMRLHQAGKVTNREGRCTTACRWRRSRPARGSSTTGCTRTARWPSCRSSS